MIQDDNFKGKTENKFAFNVYVVLNNKIYAISIVKIDYI